MHCIASRSVHTLRPSRPVHPVFAQQRVRLVVKAVAPGHPRLVSTRAATTDAQTDAYQKCKDIQRTGETVDVKVKSFNKGGLVVMYGNVKGFIPYTQMNSMWAKKGEITGDLGYLIGQTLKAKVIAVDVEGDRKEVIFSERKAQQCEAMRGLKVGDVKRAVVASVEEYGAFVDLLDVPGVSGLVHKSELSWDPVMTVDAVLKKGQPLRVKVIDVDASKCRLSLSVKQLQPDPIKMTIDKVIWEATKVVVPEVQKLCDRLQLQEGISHVNLGRQAQEQHIMAQELEVYLTRGSSEGGFNIVARIGNVLQELHVDTTLSAEEFKGLLQQVVRNVAQS